MSLFTAVDSACCEFVVTDRGSLVERPEMSMRSKVYRLVRNKGNFDTKPKDRWAEIRRLKGLARQEGYSVRSLPAIYNHIRSQRKAASTEGVIVEQTAATA